MGGKEKSCPASLVVRNQQRWLGRGCQWEGRKQERMEPLRPGKGPEMTPRSGDMRDK